MNKRLIKKIFRFMTFISCALWLCCLCFYSSLLAGTLFHEATHKTFALNATAIEIRYDGSGVTYSEIGFLPHLHELAYANGNIIEVVFMTISIFAILLVFIYGVNTMTFNDYIIEKTVIYKKNK